MLDVFYSEGGNYPHSTNLSMEDYWHFVIQFNFSKCIQVPQSLLDFFSIWPCCTTISKDMKNAPPHLPCAEYILLQCMFSKEKKAMHLYYQEVEWPHKRVSCIQNEICSSE